jgi:hypothetical protein
MREGILEDEKEEKEEKASRRAKTTLARRR